MTCYLVTFKFRNDIEDLSNSEKATAKPNHMRVSASNVTRAISQVVNALKNAEAISSKADVIFLEVKVTV